MSNVPAEAEEGLTSSRRVRDAEPHIVRTWLVCAISAARGMGRGGLRLHRACGHTTARSGTWPGGLDQTVEAGASTRVVPGARRRPARAAENRASGPSFSLCLRIWTCGLPLTALEPDRCRCGHRRGLRAEGVLGLGVQPTCWLTRHKRCSALGQDQWITSVMLPTLLVMVACISAGMIVHHGPCERREW